MKFKKFTKVYAIVTQGILMMIILAFSGFFLGRFIDKNSFTYAGIFSVVGIIIGLIILVTLLLKTGGDDNRKTE